MKTQFPVRILAIFILALALPGVSNAQVLYGSLTGNVTDQSGAVVVGAKVEALNVSTGVAKTAVTDERGVFLFSDLQAGVYRLTITAPAFKSLTQENIKIDANTRRRLDAEMQVGEVSAAVQISAETPALQTERADVNITQSARQINNLPLF